MKLSPTPAYNFRPHTSNRAFPTNWHDIGAEFSIKMLNLRIISTAVVIGTVKYPLEPANWCATGCLSGGDDKFRERLFPDCVGNGRTDSGGSEPMLCLTALRNALRLEGCLLKNEQCQPIACWHQIGCLVPGGTHSGRANRQALDICISFARIDRFIVQTHGAARAYYRGKSAPP